MLPPTEEDTQIGGGRQISLTVSSFTNKNGQSNATPVLTGFTEPGAQVMISIFPDGVGTTVTADSSGRWTWKPMKPLSPGLKNLLVVAKKDIGQGQAGQAFTVVAGTRSFSTGTIIIILIILGVVGGTIFYFKSRE